MFGAVRCTCACTLQTHQYTGDKIIKTMKTSSPYFSSHRKVVSDPPQDEPGSKTLPEGRGIRRLNCRTVEKISAGIKEEPGEDRTISEAEGCPHGHRGSEKPYVTGGLMMKTSKLLNVKY